MRLIFIVFIILFSSFVEALSLKDDPPNRYVVQPGDTLWYIAAKYLHNPWEWKDLWEANPQVKNPDKLYPGAILELHFFKKRPYLKVLSNGIVKLSPHVRARDIGEAILPIPLHALKPFLNASLVTNDQRFQNAPYVVAFMGEHMLGGQGDSIYVKGLHPSCALPKGGTISYAIYRPGCPYIDPETKETLGYRARFIGNAELVRGGEPAVVRLTDITEGVRLKDRLLLNDYPEFQLDFLPKAPQYPVLGQIIDFLPAYTQGAVGLVGLINRGQNAGLEAGDVLAIFKPCQSVCSPVNHHCQKLPRERMGEMMIFRTFAKTSLGLVVRSVGAIHPRDLVTNP